MHNKNRPENKSHNFSNVNHTSTLWFCARGANYENLLNVFEPQKMRIIYIGCTFTFLVREGKVYFSVLGVMCVDFLLPPLKIIAVLK